MAQRKIDHHSNLVLRLRENDRQAQFEIYRLYNVAMYNTALRIVQDTAEAEDVLQEAFLAAFTKIGLYKGDATFGAWLKRIVVNKSINAVNKRKASLISMDEVSSEGLPEPADEQASDDHVVWNVDQIARAINDLPDGYRIVFSLYLLEGYDHREIASILGISEGGSKSQYNRAKKKLREILTAQSYV